jgi:ComF family protein
MASMTALQTSLLTHAARVSVALQAPLRRALDLALPPLCPACREPIGSGKGLCAACWSKLSPIAPPYCERLGIPFVYDPGPGILSMQAIADPPAYTRARAARLDLAPMIGGWMVRAGKELLAEADVLVPVPLHWRRLWARRFNQAALLAQVISRITRVPAVNDVLVRVKATPHQVGLSRTERAENVQGAFRVSAKSRTQIAGRCVLLVDDVLTSGATADTCARALLRAGAGHVDVLVFARVVEATQTTI